MLNFCRWLLQLFLLALVCFFGYHYYTRPELHACLSAAIATLQGKKFTTGLDEAKVNHFLDELRGQLDGVANKGNQLWQHLSSVESTASGNPRDEFIDGAQYLYCRAVIDKVERRSTSDS